MGAGTFWLQQERASREDVSLISSIEERLGALVGMRTHRGENTIKVTSHTPLPRDRSRAAYNVHHEKVGRPRRAATVLVYLSTPTSAGGHTIFPAASRNRTVVEAFRALTPPAGRYWRINERGAVSERDSIGLRSPEAHAMPAVAVAQAAADDLCRRAAAAAEEEGSPLASPPGSPADAAADGRAVTDAVTESTAGEPTAANDEERSAPWAADAVAVAPRQGVAVVWYHEHPKAEVHQRSAGAAAAHEDDADDATRLRSADALAWHCGCGLLAPAGAAASTGRDQHGGGMRGRWALQKFKELPKYGSAARFHALQAAHLADVLRARPQQPGWIPA